HYRRGSDYCAVTFGRRHLTERHDVRCDGFLGARAAASETVGIEQCVDQPIGIVVGFGQRLAHGAPPELARLDALEIDGHGDALAKIPDQRMVAGNRIEVSLDFLNVEKFRDRACYSIDSERSRRRFELHKALDMSGAVSAGRALEAERIEPAGERATLMDRAARPLKRGASPVGEKAQERAAAQR